MFTTGYTSITFRKRPWQEIISLAAQAGLDGIEWGGDGHVQPADPAAARRLGEATREAGLQVLSLGSYYRAGVHEFAEFERVLRCAEALETKMIRVWAGSLGSAEAEGEARRACVADLRRVCPPAAASGITVSTEYHGNTLTDTCASTLRMLEEADCPELRTYWQPVISMSREENVRDLRAILPYTTNIHVFYWNRGEDGKSQRRGLAEGRQDWQAYLDLLRESGKTRSLIIEFVRDDNPDAFLEDAAALRSWLR